MRGIGGGGGGGGGGGCFTRDNKNGREELFTSGLAKLIKFRVHGHREWT